MPATNRHLRKWVALETAVRDDDLTDEQATVATAPPTARLLVTAGPGTGKTHTLVARIAHLVEHDGVAPGGVLALSFSRAAVGELRSRLRATGSDAGRVAPVTFDSFATRVLAEVAPGGSWRDQSYDGRIEAAISRIADFGEFLEQVEHLCVDETQDLVGVRMHFVKALLEQLDVGFTLLGDPAQGIYDFTLQPDGDPIRDGSPAFYAWVRQRYRTDLQDAALTRNHRAKTPNVAAAAALGPRVLKDPVGAASALADLLDDAPTLGSLDAIENDSVNQTTAILCRNNGHALWISRDLNNQGIAHVLRRGGDKPEHRSLGCLARQSCWPSNIEQEHVRNRSRQARLRRTKPEGGMESSPSRSEARERHRS